MTVTCAGRWVTCRHRPAGRIEIAAKVAGEPMGAGWVLGSTVVARRYTDPIRRAHGAVGCALPPVLGGHLLDVFDEFDPGEMVGTEGGHHQRGCTRLGIRGNTVPHVPG